MTHRPVIDDITTTGSTGAAAELLAAVADYQAIEDDALAEWYEQRRGRGRVDAAQPGGVLAEHERRRERLIGALAVVIGCDADALSRGLP